MRASKSCAVLVAALTAAMAACGGSTVSDSAASPADNAAGAQNHDLEAGASGAGEPDGAAGASGAGAGASDNACQQQHDVAPGPGIVQLSQKGSGVCASATLADAIAQVHALRPDLSDVSALYDSQFGGDGSFIYAFAKADGGFALAFKRGGGDCPAGCTENDYWYFETDAACTVSQVGESHLVANDGGFGACVPSDQQPRWGVPAAAAPRDICGADNSPVQLSGRYDLVACGSDSACAFGGEAVSPRTLPSTLSLEIEQNPSDLSQGTVTLQGTGEAVLDAQPLPATFDRQSFVVHVDHSDLPAACVENWTIDLSYDFEGYGTRSLRLFQVHTPDCANEPGAYCKGQLSADLGDAHLRD